MTPLFFIMGVGLADERTGGLSVVTLGTSGISTALVTAVRRTSMRCEGFSGTRELRWKPRPVFEK